MCYYCGQQNKRTYQHTYAGCFRDSPNNKKFKMCKQCHHNELNPLISRQFNLGTVIPTQTLIGKTLVSSNCDVITCNGGSLSIPLPSNSRIVEINGRALDFNARDYPPKIIAGNQNEVYLLGGSVGGHICSVIISREMI